MYVNGKKKLVLVIPSLEMGGAEKLTAMICDYLNYEEYEVHLISLSDKITLYNGLKHKDKIHLYTCSCEDKGFWNISFSAIYKFIKHIRCIKPDIVHAHLWGVYCIYLFFLKKNSRIFISTIHSSGFIYTSKKWICKLFKSIENTSYRWYKFHLVSISKSVDDMIRKELYFKSLTRITNGVPRNAGTPQVERVLLQDKLDITDKDFVLVNVGRADDNKRQIDIIEAVALLRSYIPEIKLLLVGKDTTIRYKEVIAELGLEKAIKCLGIRDDAPKIMSICNIGIFPSIYEGLPLTLLEMMMAGLPVVISDISPLKEITNNGKNALVVPVKSPQKIAEAVKMLYNNKDLYQTLSKCGQKMTIDRYSIETMVSQYENLYFKLYTKRNSLD